jgi:hypothetical protein
VRPIRVRDRVGIIRVMDRISQCYIRVRVRVRVERCNYDSEGGTLNQISNRWLLR